MGGLLLFLGCVGCGLAEAGLGLGFGDFWFGFCCWLMVLLCLVVVRMVCLDWVWVFWVLLFGV